MSALIPLNFCRKMISQCTPICHRILTHEPLTRQCSSTCGPESPFFLQVPSQQASQTRQEVRSQPLLAWSLRTGASCSVISPGPIGLWAHLRQCCFWTPRSCDKLQTCSVVPQSTVSSLPTELAFASLSKKFACSRSHLASCILPHDVFVCRKKGNQRRHSTDNSDLLCSCRLILCSTRQCFALSWSWVMA